MSDETSEAVSRVGFREFLFYIVPGSVIVAAIALLRDLTVADVAPFLNVAGAVAGLLGAYFLGQVNYTVSTLLRAGLREAYNRFRKQGSPTLTSDGNETFIRRQLSAARAHPAFYANEALRYRSLARSYVTLCVPSILLGFALAARVPARSVVYIVSGVFVAAGFALRFVRCDRMYHGLVEICASSQAGRDMSSE